jgi:hypothetical protein
MHKGNIPYAYLWVYRSLHTSETDLRISARMMSGWRINGIDRYSTY